MQRQLGPQKTPQASATRSEWRLLGQRRSKSVGAACLWVSASLLLEVSGDWALVLKGQSRPQRAQYPLEGASPQWMVQEEGHRLTCELAGRRREGGRALKASAQERRVPGQISPARGPRGCQIVSPWNG